MNHLPVIPTKVRLDIESLKSFRGTITQFEDQFEPLKEWVVESLLSLREANLYGLGKISR